MYDIIIIGAGFAGYGAAIYTSRYNMKTLIIAKVLGGTITESYLVDNYLGFFNVTGYDIMQKAEEQVRKLGAEIKDANVNEIVRAKDKFIVKASEGDFEAKRILLAMGSKKRRLNIPGEDKFSGRGVSYCFTCDAAFFKGKKVGVVGGGNSAIEAATLLAKYAAKVYILYRGDSLKRVEPIMVDELKKLKNVEVKFNTEVKEIKGDKLVKSVVFKDGSEFPLDGIFVEIGADPASELAKKLGVKTTEKGHIIVDHAQRTNAANAYAAGDITTGSNMFEQGVCAASEGAIAAESAYKDMMADMAKKK